MHGNDIKKEFVKNNSTKQGTVVYQKQMEYYTLQAIISCKKAFLSWE
jgi:hypothetical protein